MAKSVKESFLKKENFKQISKAKEKTSFKKYLIKEDFENDEAFSNFKPIRKIQH